jgi:hypoxanthine phosphoribosyltransferase
MQGNRFSFPGVSMYACAEMRSSLHERPGRDSGRLAGLTQTPRWTFVPDTVQSSDPRLAGRTLARIAFDEPTISARVRELGAEITAAYPDGDLLVLGLLKGSFIFMSDLVREVVRPLQVDFLVAASYGSGVVSSGNVHLLYEPLTQFEGKHVLLVEDIVDSGTTLNTLMDHLAARRPKSLAICALLHKRIANQLQHDPQFVGFDAPNEFLVGYGLDHAENYRHLPYIASLA